MMVSALLLMIMHDGRQQQEIAVAIGIPAPRISEYVHSKRAIPSMHLMLLARELKCDPDDLVGEAELSEVV